VRVTGHVSGVGFLNFVYVTFSGKIGGWMEDKTKLAAVLDELLAGKKTEEIVGPGGLLKQLTKALLERTRSSRQRPHNLANCSANS
jgi:hypothetical protein